VIVRSYLYAIHTGSLYVAPKRIAYASKLFVKANLTRPKADGVA